MKLLPTDVVREMLFYFSPVDIVNYKLVCEQFNSIIDEKYCQKYVSQRYMITEKHASRSWLKTAAMVESFIEYGTSKGYIIPVHYFGYLLSKLNTDIWFIIIKKSLNTNKNKPKIYYPNIMEISHVISQTCIQNYGHLDHDQEMHEEYINIKNGYLETISNCNKFANEEIYWSMMCRILNNDGSKKIRKELFQCSWKKLI